MCGIIGVTGGSPAHPLLYEGLNLLQHRGQDAAGIFTLEGRRFHQHKDLGLVRDVFGSAELDKLPGSLGLGHVRYPTVGSGSMDISQAQPLYVNSPCGIALIHNGNLVNVAELEDELRSEQRHLNGDSDSEVLLNVFASELQRQVVQCGAVNQQSIARAVSALMSRCCGAYSVIAMLEDGSMIAFRDPYGIRPLVYGRRESSDGRMEYMFASESVALDVLGFQLERDLMPGELIQINRAGKLITSRCVKPRETQLRPCIFEYVYLARPDSILEGTSVYQARLRQGESLARRIHASGVHIDVVVPVPDTGRVAAQAIAEHLGLPIREGLMRNRYVGRTFIMRGQHQRRQNVRRKLNLVPSEFANRNVLLVDDSIVRGTTSRQIVELVRNFTSATNIYLASAAPPVRFQNVYGIDMPTTGELIAHGKDEAAVCASIGADALFYQTLSDLVASVPTDKSGSQHFETSIFDGRYITGDISSGYLEKLAARRVEQAWHQSDTAGQLSLFGEQRSNVSSLANERKKRVVGAGT